MTRMQRGSDQLTQEIRDAAVTYDLSLRGFTMKNVISDGGKARAGIEDSMDCTVRALSHAANIPYPLAHQIMAEEGRQVGKRASAFAGILNAENKGLLTYTYLNLSKQARTYNGAPGFVGLHNKPILITRFIGPTVRAFVDAHPKGRYIVRIKNHVFAVIDGVLYDSYRQHGGAIVKAAWKIELGGTR